jgi:hypothetical protein
LPRQTPVAALLAQASQVIIAPDLSPGYGPSLTQEGRGANDATRHH